MFFFGLYVLCVFLYSRQEQSRDTRADMRDATYRSRARAHEVDTTEKKHTHTLMLRARLICCRLC